MPKSVAHSSLDRDAQQRAARVKTAKRELAKKVCTIGAHTLKDKLLQPTPRDLDDVPWAPESVTPAWLTLAICGKHSGAEVVAIERANSTKGSSTRCAARLTYNDIGTRAGLPTLVFIKGSKTLKTRMLLGTLDLMSSEARFFHEIRPELNFECPEGYFGSYDPRTWRHCIVMEDVVATKGATFCKPTEPISRQQVEDMLSIMAAYHGKFWNSPRFDSDLSWVPAARTAKTFVEDLTTFVDLEKAATRGAVKYTDLVPEGISRNADRLSPALWKSLDFAVSGPQTLIHGDSHLGNFYRTADGRMGIFDWQTCGLGSWTFDVSYMLSAALTIEDRRAWERDLITHYVNELKLHGVQDKSLEYAFDSYRRGLMYPLFAWLFVLNHSPLQPQMQPRDTGIELSRRITTAVDDLDVLDLLEV